MEQQPYTWQNSNCQHNHSYPDDENPDDKWNQPEPDYKHYLTFDFNKVRWGPLIFDAFQKLNLNL